MFCVAVVFLVQWGSFGNGGGGRAGGHFEFKKKGPRVAGGGGGLSIFGGPELLLQCFPEKLNLSRKAIGALTKFPIGTAITASLLEFMLRLHAFQEHCRQTFFICWNQSLDYSCRVPSGELWITAAVAGDTVSG